MELKDEAPNLNKHEAEWTRNGRVFKLSKSASRDVLQQGHASEDFPNSATNGSQAFQFPKVLGVVIRRELDSSRSHGKSGPQETNTPCRQSLSVEFI